MPLYLGVRCANFHSNGIKLFWIQLLNKSANGLANSFAHCLKIFVSIPTATLEEVGSTEFNSFRTSSGIISRKSNDLLKFTNIYMLFLKWFSKKFKQNGIGIKINLTKIVLTKLINWFAASNVVFWTWPFKIKLGIIIDFLFGFIIALVDCHNFFDERDSYSINLL